MIGPLVLPAALAAGIALQLAFPGDFGPGLEEGGPGAGDVDRGRSAASLAIVVGLRRERRIEARTWIVTCARSCSSACPSPSTAFGTGRPRRSVDPHALTPGLLHALRTEVPKRAVVFSDLETSYRIGAFAPVYVAAAPPAHVADTPANRPYRRRYAVNRFFGTGDLAILDRYHADWLVVDKQPLPTSPVPGRSSTRTRATRSTIARHESPARDDVLPARRAAAACSGR